MRAWPEAPRASLASARKQVQKSHSLSAGMSSKPRAASRSSPDRASPSRPRSRSRRTSAQRKTRRAPYSTTDRRIVSSTSFRRPCSRRSRKSWRRDERVAFATHRLAADLERLRDGSPSASSRRPVSNARLARVAATYQSCAGWRSSSASQANAATSASKLARGRRAPSARLAGNGGLAPRARGRRPRLRDERSRSRSRGAPPGCRARGLRRTARPSAYASVAGSSRRRAMSDRLRAQRGARTRATASCA